MLNRKTSSFIGHFYEVNKGALLLIGAHQIGKTSYFKQYKMHPEFTISEAVVLCNDNLYVENSVTHALYMMFIHKAKPTNVMFSLDLSELQ